MKRITVFSIIVCVLAAACTQRPDDSEFIREMYEKIQYENYSFLEKHCSKSLLAKLSEQYDYDGEGYAVWKFRSGVQDDPSIPEAEVIRILRDSGYSGWLTVEHFGARDMLKAATESFGFVAACLASK